MKIEYIKCGDYYIPNLTIPKTEPIGRFGRMLLKYLKEHKRTVYSQMKINGTLFDYIADIDRQANEMYEDFMGKFRRSIESTCDSQEEWVRRMNFAKHYVEEIILNDIIYC